MTPNISKPFGKYAAAVFVGLLTTASGADDLKLDYQQIADGARWGWDEKKADLLYCASVAVLDEGYDIQIAISHERPRTIQISLKKKDKEAFSLIGHYETAFQIHKDKLYYADYDPRGPGGMIVAVDLSTGKEIWRSKLTALPLDTATRYSNLINLEIDNDDCMMIQGFETKGKYIEFKRLDTGETVGHHIFK